MQRIRKMMAHEGGFTLIELLIVIIILGILAAIVVFAVGGITNRGLNAACQADYKTVEIAQEAYFAKYSAYAGSVAALNTNNPQFIKDVPGTTNYTIATSSSGVVTVNGSPGTGSCPA